MGGKQKGGKADKKQKREGQVSGREGGLALTSKEARKQKRERGEGGPEAEKGMACEWAGSRKGKGGRWAGRWFSANERGSQEAVMT